MNNFDVQVIYLPNFMQKFISNSQIAFAYNLTSFITGLKRSQCS